MSAFGCTCSHEHTEIREELDELRAGLMLPGAQECVTCGFSLQKMVMRASDGAVGMKHDAPLERCPNGHGYLVGVTYERAWRQMVKAAEERDKQQQALDELKRVLLQESVQGLEAENARLRDEAGAAENARLSGILQMAKAAGEAIAERERLHTLAMDLAEGFREMTAVTSHCTYNNVHRPDQCRVCKATALLQRAKEQGIGG